ncbi:hypothetical protein [Sphingomonas sp.]|uniref:hypothetical protein n=1 Tax=Sphingomonas sp. TaxID=28214 RepID=UPI0031E4168A
MADNAVNTPPLDAGPAVLADWLELAAFFDARARARLDDIDNAFKIQDQEAANDDGEADAAKEDRRARIEGEIAERTEHLGEAYPFVLSADGEELALKPRNQLGTAAFYLLCLIFSHATKSAILERTPSARALAQARRRHFQILSTLAVAGHVGGPALSFGWPRKSGQTIVQAIERACLLSGVGTARNPPGPVASKYAKDGGIDVIAWRPAVNLAPPPAEMCFGQAASGHGWREKNAPDEIPDFYESFYLNRPPTNTVGVTIIPFRLQPDDHATYGYRHGHILDRLRTPRAAVEGLRLARQYGVIVDDADDVGLLGRWILGYRSQVRHAA